MINTPSETPAQVTPKPRISNRVQVRLDRVEKALCEIALAVTTVDDELSELTCLISDGADDQANDLSREARAMVHTLNDRFFFLCQRVEDEADADDEEAAS